MTWWVNSRDGYVQLMDDGVLIASFLTQEAADEVLGMHDLIEQQAALLTGVVNAIRGAPPELVLWSHHDAPALAQQVMAQLQRLRAFAQIVKGVLPVCTDSAVILLEDIQRLEAKWSTPLRDQELVP